MISLRSRLDALRAAGSWSTVQQTIVFCVVGVLLAVIYFVLAHAVSAIMGLEPQTASGFAYLIMIPIAYYAHRIVTFRFKGSHRVALVRFTVTAVIGVLLSYWVPYFAVRLFAVSESSAYLATCIVVPALNFFLMRVWVFFAVSDEPITSR